MRGKRGGGTFDGEGDGGGALEASRDLEPGQVASRVVPIAGPTAEPGVRAAMVDLGTRAAMADQETQAAMVSPGSPWAMASPGPPWAMVGSPPPKKNYWGDCCPGGALEAQRASWTGPVEAQVSWTGPAEAKVSWTGPAEAKVSLTESAEVKVSWTGPVEAKVSWTGPTLGGALEALTLSGYSGSAESRGRSGSAELDSANRDEGELDGTSGDEDELDGTSGDEDELDGTSGDEDKLDGTSGDKNELGGASGDTSGLTCAANGGGLELISRERWARRAVDGGYGPPRTADQEELRAAAALLREQRQTSRERRAR